MPHDTPLISTIVAGLVLAFIFGAIANRLKMPPLVGYLLAGVAVGPFTPGFVADAELATELSEIGVILLMFGVGLHFSLKDLLSVRAIAIPGAVVQIAGATVMGLGLALLLGWTVGAGLVFGLALSVASTVVLLKALQDRHLVESERGRIAVGWLIVEDIAMVLALVLIPALSTLLGGTASEVHDPFVDLFERFTGIEASLWGVLGITLVKLAAFVGFMLVVGRRFIPWGLHMTAHTGSRELFRLAVLAIALGVAAGSAYLFGVSLALGAFFAGMILSESELSNRAAQETLPLRDAFAVLFFVSVGMLFDPSIIIERPLDVLATVFIIIIGKSAFAFLIGVAFRQPVGTSLTIAASLAQIGEFSFILAALGVGLGILPQEGRDLILAGALISIVLNPAIFFIAEAMRPRLEARVAAKHPGIVVANRVEPELSTAAAAPAAAPVADIRDESLPTALTGHTVLIGYGGVGTVVADGLQQQHAPFVLIEDAEPRIAVAQAAGIEVIVGNAATPETLALANIDGARTLIVAIPNAFEAGQAVEQSRKHNPALIIIARAHSDEEVSYLRDLGANEVIMGEREIGLGMLGFAHPVSDEDAQAGRERASLDAVAAALKLEGVMPLAKPAPVAPAIPIEELEAAIEAAHPAHVPEGPAEPPEVVPALGETPVEPAEEEAEAPAVVLIGEMPSFELVPEATVHFAAGEPDEPAEPELPAAPRPPRAGGPATTPGAPYKPEVEPAGE
ncbi:MAG: sodium:proton antiporter [Hyphomicrobiales bacterium]|nr:MAG: sodium:proton antiporter [Hyphomicrobiales bacterium]